MNTLHNDLLGVIERGGGKPPTSPRSQDRHRVYGRGPTSDERTQACGDVGLQAIKPSGLVREMLISDASRSVNGGGQVTASKSRKSAAGVNCANGHKHRDYATA